MNNYKIVLIKTSAFLKRFLIKKLLIMKTYNKMTYLKEIYTLVRLISQQLINWPYSVYRTIKIQTPPVTILIKINARILCQKINKIFLHITEDIFKRRLIKNETECVMIVQDGVS